MSFRVRRLLKGTGGARIGTSASYTNFGVDGRQTMVGAARVKKDQWIPAPNFFLDSASTANGKYFTTGSMALVSKAIAFSKGSASVFSGCFSGCATFPVMTNEAASVTTAMFVFATTVVPKPLDADTSGCIEVRQVWTVLDERLTANCSMAFKVGAAYLTSSASLRTAACIESAASYPSTGASTFVETSIGNLQSWGSNDIGMVLTAGMDWSSGSTSNGSGFAILGYKLRYVANTLGTQAT